jgi:transposase
MTRYVGLDVHSKQSVFVIQDAAGTCVAEGDVPTTPAGLRSLRDRHRLPAATPVALETGTVAFFVARQLAALGLRPVVVDAHEVRIKAHRPTQKSDRRDARALCDGLRGGIYQSIVHVPPHDIAVLRDTLWRRRHFVRVQAAEICAVKSLLRAAGQGQLSRYLRNERGWSTLLATLEAGALRSYIEHHHALWRCADEQRRALEASLNAQAVHFAGPLRQLQTIPGVGPIVAATALAVLSDVTRFPDAKHAASYVGVIPSMRQTGTHNPPGRLTRRGSAELRALLCEAAHQARRASHPLNPYFAQLCARRGYRMAVMAVAHRLARIIYAMLRRGSDFDVAKLGVEAGRFEHTTVRAYRLRKLTRATRMMSRG